MSTFLNQTLGALLIGFTVSTFLFGITTIQAYMYFTNFPKDKAWLKGIVWAVWLLELVHFISCCHSLWGLFIENFGNIGTLLTTPVGIHVSSMTANLLAFIVKGFFIFRVHNFANNYFLAAFLSIGLFGANGSFLYASILAILQKGILAYATKYGWLIVLSSSLAAASDVCITVSLCWILRIRTRGMSDTSSSPSARITPKIILWTLETCLFTTTVMIALAITSALYPLTFIWAALWVCSPRCYANCMLATLNGRVALRSITNSGISVPLSTFAVSRPTIQTENGSTMDPYVRDESYEDKVLDIGRTSTV